MTRIAVLMTCHNRRTATLACLSSLENQINNSDFSLTTYLVDEGCTDGTAEAVANHPKIHIIRGDGNLYWNRGMQLAFSTARRDNHDGYLWLNDDVVLDQDALSRLSHSV